MATQEAKVSQEIRAYYPHDDHFHRFNVSDTTLTRLVQAVETQFAKTVVEAGGVVVMDQHFGRLVQGVELDGNRFTVYLSRVGIDQLPGKVLKKEPVQAQLILGDPAALGIFELFGAALVNKK